MKGHLERGIEIISYNESVKRLASACNEFGLEVERTTEVIKTFAKTPVKRNNNHPFAKYFKPSYK